MYLINEFTNEAGSRCFCLETDSFIQIFRNESRMPAVTRLVCLNNCQPPSWRHFVKLPFPAGILYSNVVPFFYGDKSPRNRFVRPLFRPHNRLAEKFIRVSPPLSDCFHCAPMSMWAFLFKSELNTTQVPPVGLGLPILVSNATNEKSTSSTSILKEFS